VRNRNAENNRKEEFKVLFVYPNTMMATLVPINVSLLTSCLRNKGFVVDLFDTTYYRTEDINFEMKKVELLQLKPFSYKDKGIGFKETSIYEDLNKKIAGFKPDLIAITIVEDTWDLAKSLLEASKDCNVPVIAGGVFVTFSPEEVISSENVDMICVGEGEEAIVELCERLSRHEDVSGIKNIWVKTNGRITKNPLRRLVDINTVPFIDYDVFERKRLYRPMYGKIYVMAHVELDRGCPYDCTYCEAPHLRMLFEENGCGKYYRRKSPRRMVEELKYIVNKYSPDYLNFNSETFLARPIGELEEFAGIYKEIGLPFWCQTRPETITEDNARILKDMGCQNLQFGIEHGNEKFRSKMLNRHCSNEKMLNGLKIVEKSGIKYTVNNIIGFPDETRELIFDTINFNRLINPATINCYLFTPYRGTRLYKYCVDRGYIDEDTKVHQLLDAAELKMSSISYTELKGLQRAFSLYVRFPISEFETIKMAEKFDENGNKAFEELSRLYYDRFFK
jgi:radical SAM superfamily enzyme YgiQ (UPF0313 family)